jgi:uncharacterized integral membrane protein
MVVFLVIALIVSILASTFALQNAVPITVTFLLWQFEGSLALVLLSAFALGVAVGLLALAPPMLRRRREISRQSRKITELETTLHERSAPPERPPPPD